MFGSNSYKYQHIHTKHNFDSMAKITIFSNQRCIINNTNSCTKYIIIVINTISFYPILLKIIALEATTNNKLKSKSPTYNSINKLTIKIGKKPLFERRHSPPLTPSARVKAKSSPLHYYQCLTSKGEKTITSYYQNETTSSMNIYL